MVQSNRPLPSFSFLLYLGHIHLFILFLHQIFNRYRDSFLWWGSWCVGFCCRFNVVVLGPMVPAAFGMTISGWSLVVAARIITAVISAVRVSIGPTSSCWWAWGHCILTGFRKECERKANQQTEIGLRHVYSYFQMPLVSSPDKMDHVCSVSSVWMDRAHVSIWPPCSLNSICIITICLQHLSVGKVKELSNCTKLAGYFQTPLLKKKNRSYSMENVVLSWTWVLSWTRYAIN